ncbi:MAG: DinB family protein [Anaerolineae bacterium]
MLALEFVSAIERLSSSILAELEAVAPEALNWRPPFPDANSMYVLAVHTTGAAEWWIVGAAAGQPVRRDRPAEFRSGGDLASVKAWYTDKLAAIRQAAATVSDADLSATRSYTTMSGRAEENTAAYCFLHAIEHAAEHLGHIQITRQLWEQQQQGQ